MTDDELLPEDNSNGEDEEEDLEFFDEMGLAGEDEDEMDFFDDFDGEADPIQRSLEITDTNLDKFMSISTADSVYGEPIEYEDAVIIPAAELMSVMGFGVGYGGGGNVNLEEAPAANGEGGGGGGGGYAYSRPVAVIIASPEGVRIEPVVDVTKLALAALAALGFMASAIFRIRRGR
jgi:uncharacterized spore protein YtfJ